LLTLSFDSVEVKSPKDTTTSTASSSSSGAFAKKESEFLSDKVKKATNDEDLREIQQNMTKLGMTVASTSADKQTSPPPPPELKKASGKAAT
jgi:hypothetical protein